MTKTYTKADFHGSRARKRSRAMIADSTGLRGETPSESRDGIRHRTVIDAFGAILCDCEDARYRKTRQTIFDAPSKKCKHGRLITAALIDAERLRRSEESEVA